MAQVAFPVVHEVVVDTVARTVRHRATITAWLERAEPGEVWPEPEVFEGIGVTLEDAIRAAFQAYRASRG